MVTVSIIEMAIDFSTAMHGKHLETITHDRLLGLLELLYDLRAHSVFGGAMGLQKEILLVLIDVD